MVFNWVWGPNGGGDSLGAVIIGCVVYGTQLSLGPPMGAGVVWGP